MTRDQVITDILKLTNHNLLLMLATSVGKTRCALEYLNSKHLNFQHGGILVVIPRLVLINNWKDEFIRWGFAKMLPFVTFSTYVSLPKLEGQSFQCVIYDECHHLSERCLESVPHIKTKYNILLSATVKQNHLQQLKQLFAHLHVYTVPLRQAIDDNILPDPDIYLIPLQLNTENITCTFVKNANKTVEKHIQFVDMWKELKNPQSKQYKLIIHCTPMQYYNNMTNLISYYYNKSYHPLFKNKYLKLCNDRLKWLSQQKEQVVLRILEYLKDKRTLTFCSSIQQTENLGKYCLNSKNAENTEKILQKFQNGEINHITACDMLNEGANLRNCQIGIFASLHSSNIIITQRNGRLLRHEKPIFIIPYYKNTRDEEIIQIMLKDYNQNLVHIVKKPSDLKDI